jgi:hypothetical protein
VLYGLIVRLDSLNLKGERGGQRGLSEVSLMPAKNVQKIEINSLKRGQILFKKLKVRVDY